MKVFYFSDYYPPETNAPALRVQFHSEYFAKNGIDITVVTCNPNFPDGKLYDGYQNSWIKCEYLNDVKIVRLWSFIAENKGYLKRILDHISSAFMFFLYSLHIRPSEVVIATSPQFMTILFLTFAKHIKKFKLIIEVRDKWPDGIIFLNRKSSIFKLLKKIEHWIYSSSDLLIVVTSSFKEQIIRETGCTPEKIVIAYNGADLNKRLKYRSCYAASYFLPKFCGLTIGYAGTIGISHDLIDFCKKFRNMHLLHCRLVFLGSGVLFDEMKVRFGCERILFLEKIAQEAMPQFYKEIDIALVSLKDIEIYDHVIPSKLFEAVAYETPIYGLLRGEAARIIQDNDVGIVPKTRKLEDQEKALKSLMCRFRRKEIVKNLTKTGEKYSRINQAEVILKCLKRKF